MLTVTRVHVGSSWVFVETDEGQPLFLGKTPLSQKLAVGDTLLCEGDDVYITSSNCHRPVRRITYSGPYRPGSGQ